MKQLLAKLSFAFKLSLLATSLFSISTSQASHVTGGNITYECTGNPNEFLVTLTLFNDCGSAAISTTPYLDFANDCGYTMTSSAMTQVGAPVDVSQLCPSVTSECAGGTYPGYQMYTYELLVTLPGPCDSWTFSYDLCCRNTSTNVSGASSDDIYVEAVLNSNTAPCNSSPQVTGQPIPYMCAGQASSWSPNVSEPDGNTLVFSLISAMDFGGVPVTYVAPFTGASPIQGMTIDPNTGLITVTPTMTGNYVIAVLIEEYDANGNLVGSIVQDFQIEVINCTNSTPTPPAAGITNFSGTATQGGANSISICSLGESFCFDVTFTDPDGGNNLTLTSNATSILPGATFTQTGTNPATATICWTSVAGYTGNLITILAEDDACPINGTSSFVIDLDIAPPLTVSGATTYCGNGSALLSAIGAGPFTWTSISGDPLIVGTNFTCNPCSNPTATPTQTTTYEVTDGCGNTEQVTVTVVPNTGGIDATVTTADQTICPGQCVNLNGTTLEDFSVNQQQTFSANPNAAISSTIGTTSSTINVSGLSMTNVPVGGIESVCLNIDHTFDGDLDIFLVCPGGTTLELSTDNGGGGDNYSGTCFTISAVQNITAGTAPFTGNFLPEGGTLDAFAGCLANGNWTLQVTDDAAGDIGTLLSWSITFNDQSTGQGPATSFTWTPTTNMTGANTLTPQVCPTTTTSYTLTAFDQNGCFDTDDVTITVVPLNPPTLTPTHESCAGANDGSITATPNGGTAPYTYNLTGTSTATNGTGVFNGLADGNYTVTYTDANNCSGTANVTINPGPTISANIANAANQCLTGNSFTFNGSGSTISNGTITSYNWNFGDSNTGTGQTPTHSYTNAGNYVVTLTVSNGTCTHSTTINITVNPNPTVTASGTNITCNGANDGTVSAVGAGTSGYSYAWNNGAGNGANVNGLGPNTYTVTVTDINGCTATDNVTISEPPAITSSIAGTNASCAGINDGTATVTANGGTGALNYNWAPAPGSGQGTNSAGGLVGGTAYTVTITDANNCSVTETFTPTVPAAINVTATATDANCGASDGTLVVNNVTGGSGTYTSTVWVDDATSLVVGNPGAVPAGSYTVTVTDNNGCTGTATVAVSGLAGPTVSVTGQTNASCSTVCNGTASINATGGSGALTYVWAPAPGGGQGTPNATGLCGGTTYTVTVTDAGGCSDVTNVNIGTDPDPTAAIALDQNAQCNGVCDGQATATMTGGTAAFTYAWSNSETTQQAVALCVGNHTVTITDANGCAATANIAITEPTGLTLNIAGTDATCNGVCDGSADATITGGTAPYTTVWQHGPTSEDLNGVLCANNYTLDVTDNQGCTVSASVTINEPTAITSSITGTNVTCNGANDGTATVTAGGGTGALSYNWVPAPGSGQGTNSAGGLVGGTAYTVTVTDGNGCTVTETFTPTEPTPLVVNASGVNSNCGQSDGSVSANASGGTTGYNFEWFDNAALTNSIGTGANIGTLPAGTYYIQVTDANNCTASTSVSIVDNNGGSITSTQTEVLCNGGTDGSINVTVTGGTPNFTYNWTGPGAFTSNNEDLTGLAAGTYDVTVTDAVGCILTLSATITEPALLTVTANGSDALCFGNSDGTLSASASGGTAAYSYEWYDNAALTSNIGSGTPFNNVGANTYYVEVTDANGCTASNSFTVNEPAQIVPVVTSTDANCGQSDGSVSVTSTSGGSGNYVSETWVDDATGLTVPNINAVPGGSYTVTVTDDNGCTGTATVGVNNNSGPTLSINTQTGASCFGVCDGLASLTTTGGTAGYTYNWTPMPGSGQGTDNVSGLCAGNYNATVTDANGCVDNITITITEPPVLDITITASSDVTINGGNDGSANSTANGGTPGYTYEWYNGCPPGTTIGQTTSNATNLSAGTYSVIVTDNKGCLDTTCVTINEPNTISTVLVSTDALCNSSCDGSATVTASGGVGGYTYQWFDAATNNPLPGQTGVTALNLCAGDYYVQVTDANGGSTNSLPITINEPTVISGTTSVTSNFNGADISCNGACDGAANIAASGGTPGYLYQWNDPANSTTAAINGLCAGTYDVVVTDFNGCTNTFSVNLSEPTPLANNNNGTNASCFGVCDGSVTATTSGGTAPYTYQWNDPALSTTTTVNGLCAGTYNVTITDANGCSINDQIIITEPTELILSSTTVGSNCGQTDGSATVSIVQGDPNFTYQWDAAAGNQTTATASNVGFGCYTVTVTDGNGCTATETACVQDLGAPTITPLTVNDVNCNAGCDGFAQVQVTGGLAPYNYQWFDNASNPISGISTTPSVNNLCAGTYTAEMTDANGCVATTSITINEPLALNAVVSNTVDVTCFGDCDGIATVTASGGTLPFTYQWNDPASQTTATATALCPGTYTCTVTDANNCTFNINATIGEPLQILLTASAVDAFCNTPSGSSNVNIIQGGVGNISYAWNPTGQTGQSATNLLPGNYTVTVTDQTGCSATANATVGNIPPGIASITNTTDVLCFGGSDGTATVSMNGGAATFNYEWFNSNGTPIGQTTQTATGLSIGQYYALVTDANGCLSNSDTIAIAQPNDITINFTVDSVGCAGACTGFATANVGGGTAPYSYQWNNALMEITPSAQGLCAQNYTVNVVDDNGCPATANVDVYEPVAVQLDSTVVNANCGQPDGQACVLASGGVAPYSYLWPSGNTNSCDIGLAANTYLVEVTDANDCISVIPVEVQDLNGPAASIVAQTDASCAGLSDGSATVDMTGGAGASFTVQWDANAGNQTTPTASNLAAGNYSVTITDDIGCSASTSVTINEPLPLQFVDYFQDNSCFGSCDGSAWVNLSGGTAPYNYAWVNNAGNPMGATDSISNLCVDDYTVNITDANGCAVSTTVTVSEPPQVSATASSTNISCNGACDGTATATGVVGVGPFTYLWNDPNAQTTAFAGGLCPGTYTCTVTDADGCFTTVSVTITEPTPVSASITVFGNVNCTNACDGFAQADPAGGTPGYTFSWDNGAGLAQIATNLCANTYTATVTDANNCSATATVTITEPLPLGVSSTTTNVTCFNACNGSASIQLSGGTGPFNYQWDDPAFSTTPTVNNLCAGQYTCTITDALGCQISETVIITQPNELSLTANPSDANCGQANGSICISVVGGVAPFTYQWSDINTTTTACVNNITAGCYTITIVDGNGCIKDSLLCINDIAGPTVTGINSSNVTCFGDMDGSVEFSVTGGTGTPTIELFDGNNTSVNTGNLLTNNLDGDCYTLIATDIAGCVGTDVICITEPNQINSAITSSTDVSCFLGCDGQATVSVSGGLPSLVNGYNYSWNAGGSTNAATNTALCAGNYTVTVSDSNNCTTTSTITITEPSQLLVNTANQVNVSCAGSCDGSINVVASGATPPYLYNWTPNVSAGPSGGALCAGAYDVVVTDGNGCVANVNFNITEPLPLALSASTINSTCTQCNGGASLTVNGGTAPFTYNWLNGGNTPNAATNTGLCPGNHTVEVTDANGCTATLQVTIIDEPAPTIDGFNVNQPTCNGLSNGSAEVLTSGGTGNLTYLWDAAAFNQISNPAVALPAGTYCVTVSDVNNCQVTNCITVGEPAPLLPVPDISTTICYGDSSQLWASGQGGTAPYTVNWTTPGLTGPGPIMVNPLTTSTYCFTITDDNGCVSPSGCVDITVLPPLDLDLTPSTAICSGSGIDLIAQATGGNGGPYVFNWTDENGNVLAATNNADSSFVNVNPSTPTWYYVTLSDGCSLDIIDSTQISINPIPSASISALDSNGCVPFTAQFIANSDIGVTYEFDFECDGVIDYSGPNSNPTFTYQTPGTYDVCMRVISADGCDTSISVNQMITVYPLPVADFTMNPPITTALNPTITFTNLSVGGISYNWDFGDGNTISGIDTAIVTGTNNGMTIGTYKDPIHTYTDTGYFDVTLTITNEFGCTDVVSYQVYVEGDYILFTPTAFTPNGDGKNDVFKPVGIGINDNQFEMYIFDRWGQLIFESHDPDYGWDGTDPRSGRVVKLDVYVWLIRTIDHKEEPHEYIGHITVVR